MNRKYIMYLITLLLGVILIISGNNILTDYFGFLVICGAIVMAVRT